MIGTVLRDLGITADRERVHVDWCPDKLIAHAVSTGEGVLTASGSLMVETGKYTGRSPQNRYIVDAPIAHEGNVNWDSPQNRPIDVETYERLYGNVAAHLSERELFVVRAFAGADRAYARKVIVVCERASQALFISQLLVRPTADELENFGRPDIVVLAAPDYTTTKEADGVDGDATVMLNFDAKTIIVAGTGYSGEIKKGIFTTMSYLLPVEDGVLSMHCSANVDPATGKTAVLFGLSGTGKTTLSADPDRRLIGDDEHGWSPRGIFNIEGGCYAKCIDLTREREPEIYDAIKFGCLTENLVLDDATHEPDYADGSISENTRAGYPLSHIASAVEPSVGETPSVILFLTADAYGVLPPISRLDRTEAMFHFLTGYTSKVAGTEASWSREPIALRCSGEPFMPPRPHGSRLPAGRGKIARHNTCSTLVNTGWTGGPAWHRPATASRYPTHARAGARTATGRLSSTTLEHRRRRRVRRRRAPASAGRPPDLLEPRKTSGGPGRADEAAAKLVKLFKENFEKRYPGTSLEDLTSLKR